MLQTVLQVDSEMAAAARCKHKRALASRYAMMHDGDFVRLAAIQFDIETYVLLEWVVRYYK